MIASQPLGDNVTGRAQRNPNCGDMGITQISPIKIIDAEHINSVDGIAAHPTNEKEFASCSHDETLKIWDATKFTLKHDIGEGLQKKPSALGGLWSVAYDKQAGKTLLTAGSKGLVKIWDTASGKCAATLNKHTNFCYKAVFDNDGAYIASVGADRCMNYWDVRKTKEPVWTFADSPSTLLGVDFLPNDQKIVTTSLRGEISVFSVKRQ
jgi:WD40 repeat protein